MAIPEQITVSVQHLHYSVMNPSAAAGANCFASCVPAVCQMPGRFRECRMSCTSQTSNRKMFDVCNGDIQQLSALTVQGT